MLKLKKGTRVDVRIEEGSKGYIEHAEVVSVDTQKKTVKVRVDGKKRAITVDFDKIWNVSFSQCGV